MVRLKEVLAFANNKGGVGKTTTVQNVAAGLLRRNKKLNILCIDLDPQGNLSSLLGWHNKQKDVSAYGNTPTIATALREGPNGHIPVYQSRDGLYYSPASQLLATIDNDLYRQMQSKLVLSNLLRNTMCQMDYINQETGKLDVRSVDMVDFFDYVLIDCAPALNELTYNALGAAEGLVIPVQLGSLSVNGIGRMLQAYRDVQSGLNEDLKLRGMVVVMADERTNMAKETKNYLGDTYGDLILKTRIRQCVKVGESQFTNQDIFDYAPYCTAGIDYENLVKELFYA